MTNGRPARSPARPGDEPERSAWGTEQLAEFLRAVSCHEDVAAAELAAVERACEALGAEIGILMLDGEPAAGVGFAGDGVPEDVVAALRGTGVVPSTFPISGWAATIVVPFENRPDSALILARSGTAEFDPVERSLMHSMVRVLDLTLRMLQRQKLLDRLGRLQRSLSHRAPLQEVLDELNAGAVELLSVEVAGVRLIDPDDPDYCILVSAEGIHPEILEAIRRTPLKEGAGGRAILEERVVIIEHYDQDPAALKVFAADHLQAAMAAPVRENGTVAGSLSVASYKPGRRFSRIEQEGLAALAEYASLALTDAKIVEAMREAQRAKDMMLAMVSHELRTPLTVIMASLRTLEMHGERLTEDDRREMLRSGFQRGKELERLIDRLLRSAHAELAASEEEVLVRELLDHVAAAADAHGRVRVGEVSPATVRVDRAAVAEIGGILVENALSHSPEGSAVVLGASLEEGGRLAVSVRNAGSLPLDLDRDSLFQPFQRGRDATAPGVGLGLYIAARVAESAGGRIDVESEGGEVLFTLRLPATWDPDASPARSRRRAQAGSTRQSTSAGA